MMKKITSTEFSSAKEAQESAKGSKSVFILPGRIYISEDGAGENKELCVRPNFCKKEASKLRLY